MASMDRTYFAKMYESETDPWGFESSWYEQRKYALTVAALPDRRYRSAFEPGCSVGMLSSLLSERCDHLVATDIVPSAVEQARIRCRNISGVRVEQRAIPEDVPVGPFDLVVLSEVAYYFDRQTLELLLDRLVDSMTPAATIVGVHWRGVTNYPLTGDEAHEVITARPGFEDTVHHAEQAFVLDVWKRLPYL